MACLLLHNCNTFPGLPFTTFPRDPHCLPLTRPTGTLIATQIAAKSRPEFADSQKPSFGGMLCLIAQCWVLLWSPFALS